MPDQLFRAKTTQSPAERAASADLRGSCPDGALFCINMESGSHQPGDCSLCFFEFTRDVDEHIAKICVDVRLKDSHAEVKVFAESANPRFGYLLIAARQVHIDAGHCAPDFTVPFDAR